MEKFPNPAKKTPEIEKLSYQQWYPIINLYRNVPDKDRFMDALKKGGININGENVTPLDFFSTPADLTDEELEEIIKGMREYLEADSLESKMELINQSLEKSKNYILNYLQLNLPKEILNLGKLKNVSDLLKIFRKTTTTKEGKGSGLSPAYCALLSVAAASFKFRKREMGGLIKESAYLYDELFQPIDEVYNFNKLRSVSGGYDEIVMIHDDIKRDMIFADSYFRGKNEDSFITKFINIPEETVEKAAKDGIGFKFEVKSIKDVEKLIPFFTEYFAKKFGADNFMFENTKLLDFKGLDRIKGRMDGEAINFLITEKPGYKTNPNFRCFKINGELYVPKGGDTAGMKISRNFEIQIVLSDNSNETGLSNHFVYEGAKKLSAVTRLLGSFTEKYLNSVCEEASAGSKLSAERIKNYFKKNLLEEIKVTGLEKKRYAVSDIAKRFSKTGMFPRGVGMREKKKKTE